MGVTVPFSIVHRARGRQETHSTDSNPCQHSVPVHVTVMFLDSLSTWGRTGNLHTEKPQAWIWGIWTYNLPMRQQCYQICHHSVHHKAAAESNEHHHIPRPQPSGQTPTSRTATPKNHRPILMHTTHTHTFRQDRCHVDRHGGQRHNTPKFLEPADNTW